MASLAKPGSIFVSSNTRKLVKNFWIISKLVVVKQGKKG
jgi:class 3 adenylate cyclase